MVKHCDWTSIVYWRSKESDHTLFTNCARISVFKPLPYHQLLSDFHVWPLKLFVVYKCTFWGITQANFYISVYSQSKEKWPHTNCLYFVLWYPFSIYPCVHNSYHILIIYHSKFASIPGASFEWWNMVIVLILYTKKQKRVTIPLFYNLCNGFRLQIASESSFFCPIFTFDHSTRAYRNI